MKHIIHFYRKLESETFSYNDLVTTGTYNIPNGWYSLPQLFAKCVDLKATFGNWDYDADTNRITGYMSHGAKFSSGAAALMGFASATYQTSGNKPPSATWRPENYVGFKRTYGIGSKGKPIYDTTYARTISGNANLIGSAPIYEDMFEFSLCAKDDILTEKTTTNVSYSFDQVWIPYLGNYFIYDYGDDWSDLDFDDSSWGNMQIYIMTEDKKCSLFSPNWDELYNFSFGVIGKGAPT